MTSLRAAPSSNEAQDVTRNKLADRYNDRVLFTNQNHFRVYVLVKGDENLVHFEWTRYGHHNIHSE